MAQPEVNGSQLRDSLVGTIEDRVLMRIDYSPAFA